MSDILDEIRESHDYDSHRWQPIRDEGKTDMRFVAGDPWDDDDKKARKGRPTVAPEEMGQYFNQVINNLWANPRGMKFSPTGNGASPQGAEFYQNKAREIEYRSHAKIAYVTAAQNAIERSYGFVRVNTRYASPRSANQDLWIEALPNPDMVLPDTDALRTDGADAKRCMVHQWMSQAEFKRTYKDAKVQNFGDFAQTHSNWIKGTQILLGEYWTIKTRPRTLLLAEPVMPAPPAGHRLIAPVPMPPPQPVQLFEDEIEPLKGRVRVLRELRTVDYPEVFMYLTNGLEVLHQQQWPGKYIPIVSCFGKVLYVDGDTGMERKILSMTRFGRDPWKSYCYACSQELEILGQVPKASVLAIAGQLGQYQKDWEESPYIPKAFLYYLAKTAATGEQVLPPPTRLEYLQADNLQAIEVVKEGFRRSIQAAMGSNFLPTQAGNINDKSGTALDKLDQSASQGTYHFINSYEDMIRQVGVICEDLMDKIHDYRGETGVVLPDGKAQTIPINDPNNPKAISTKGDYVVTVSTAPSSDSEQDAATAFTDALVGQIGVIAEIAGPKPAAALMAQSIRMRNLGARGDQLADIIEPPEYKSQDGKPPAPEMVAAKAQIAALEQKLQQAGQVIQTKQVEQQGKLQIAQLNDQGETARAAMDREVKLAVAEIAAQTKQALQDMALFYEERARLGAQIHDHAMGDKDVAHNVHLAHVAAASDAVEGAKDRQHEVVMAGVQHAHKTAQAAQQHDNALEAGQQGIAGQLAVQDNQPPPPAAGAGA